MENNNNTFEDKVERVSKLLEILSKGDINGSNCDLALEVSNSAFKLNKEHALPQDVITNLQKLDKKIQMYMMLAFHKYFVELRCGRRRENIQSGEKLTPKQEEELIRELKLYTNADAEKKSKSH